MVSHQSVNGGALFIAWYLLLGSELGLVLVNALGIVLVDALGVVLIDQLVTRSV